MMDLDRVIHDPARLRILTILSGVESADFNFFVTTLGLTRGNQSAHMDRLEKSGYVQITKSFIGKLPHTEYRITATGRATLRNYWRALDQIRAMKG